MENNENMNNRVNENITQESKNNNKTIGIVMLVIGLLLVGFAGYKLFIEKPETDKPKNDNTQEQENNENNVKEEKYKAYDFDEVVANMKKNIYFEYEYTSDELPREIEVTPMTDKYVITLSNDGKVTIKKGDNESIEISNISNAKNIDFCNYVNVTIYILLNNGEVYEYNLDNLDKNNYVATKINEIKNATKFVKLDWADCTECGGNTNLGVIDNNNKYIELEGYSS